VEELKRLNVNPVILTGDTITTAQHVGVEIGIQEVYGALLPQDKADRIAALEKTAGPVAMVGDGVNDAPALATASVGIAMGAAGNDVAMETAHIALMNDKLSLLPFLVRLSRRMLRTIQFNTFLAISIKVIFIALAVVGFSNLVMAIVADVGVTLIVILISLRLMSFK
jgi:Cd2+/Zn2+-exporting ATPase